MLPDSFDKNIAICFFASNAGSLSILGFPCPNTNSPCLQTLSHTHRDTHTHTHTHTPVACLMLRTLSVTALHVHLGSPAFLKRRRIQVCHMRRRRHACHMRVTAFHVLEHEKRKKKKCDHLAERNGEKVEERERRGRKERESAIYVCKIFLSKESWTDILIRVYSFSCV